MALRLRRYDHNTLQYWSRAHWFLKLVTHFEANSQTPCRVSTDLDCVFPIWITQCDRVWFTNTMPCFYRFRLCLSHLNNTVGPCLIRKYHAVLRPCRFASDFSRPRHSTEFRIFPATRGHSRRTRHCRKTAGTQHGMCELARHGTAGAWKGTKWYVWICLKKCLAGKRF